MDTLLVSTFKKMEKRIRTEDFSKVFTVWRVFSNGYHDILIRRVSYIVPKMLKYARRQADYNTCAFTQPITIDHTGSIYYIIQEGDNELLDVIRFCIREDVQSIKSAKTL